jgi:uracil DNA glycosylase
MFLKHKNIIFLLWGKNAEELLNNGIISHKSISYMSSHPSPMSCWRGNPAFNGCNHFKDVNIKLTELGLPEIDWTISENIS